MLANVDAALGEQETAAALYEEAATHARRADARPALAGIMNNLGYLSLLREQPDAARETCREAAALFEELGFGEEAAGAWLNAASAEISLGDLVAARAALAEEPRPLRGPAACGRALVRPGDRCGDRGALRAMHAERRCSSAPRRRPAGEPAARCRRSSSACTTRPRRSSDAALGADADEAARAEGATLTLESALDVAYKETGDPAAD